MASETLKELKYDGKKVIAEVAKRDLDGKVISSQYLSEELMTTEFRSQIIGMQPTNHTVIIDFANLVDAMSNLYTSTYTTELYFVHACLHFENYSDKCLLQINGSTIINNDDWTMLDVDLYYNYSDFATMLSAAKVYRYNGVSVRSIQIDSNSSTNITVYVDSSTDTTSSIYIAMSCKCSAERMVRVDEE